MNRTTRALCSVIVLTFLNAGSLVNAQTNVWIGPPTGNWGVAENWSLGEVPLGFSSPNAVRIDDNTNQNSSVIADDRYFVYGLVVDSGDELTVSATEVRSGALENSGTINIENTLGPYNGLKIRETSLNTPSGLISLTYGKLGWQSPNGEGSAHLFWNQGLVEGSGTIELVAIWNEHLIDANKPVAQLSVQAQLGQGNHNDTDNLFNRGTLRASNGGTLRLFQWENGAILNQDDDLLGTIEAQGDSRVLIEKANIYGGRIQTSNTGGVEEGHVELLSSVSLQNVELDAQTTIVGDATLHNSTFANLRTITVDHGNLAIANQVAVSGGGSIELIGDATISGGTVTNLAEGTPRFINVDNTITARSSDPQVFNASTFGEGLLVDNRGVIESDGPHSMLNLDLSGPEGQTPGEAAWTNSGVIRAVNGGNLGLGFEGDTLNNTRGVIEVDDESSLCLCNVRTFGGTIRGSTFKPEPDMGLSLRKSILENVRLEGFIESGPSLNNDDYLSLVGHIDNTGTIFTHEFDAHEILIAADEVTLTGGGSISTPGFEKEWQGASRLINVDNTLRFKETRHGTASIENLEFINRGIIEANDSSTFNEFSFKDGNDRNLMTNSGIIRAIDGADLYIWFDEGSRIKNYETDEFGNTAPGTIYAGPGSTVAIGSVVGGILHADEGGVIQFGSINYTADDYGTFGIPSSAAEAHISGHVEAPYGTVLAGTIYNDGVITTGSINGHQSNGTYEGLGRVRFLGSGEIRFDGELWVPENSTLLNGPDHTISSSGFAAFINPTDYLFTNEGRIEAGNDSHLTITTASQGWLFQQRGELVAHGDGWLTVGAGPNWVNEGLIESRDESRFRIVFDEQMANEGIIRAGAGTTMTLEGADDNDHSQLFNRAGAEIHFADYMRVSYASLVNEQGGKVQGEGHLSMIFGSENERRFLNHGTVTVGDSVGQLRMAGHYEQSASGILQLELGRTTPNGSKFDVLTAWTLDLAGELEVSLVDLGEGVFEPELGDFFRILRATLNDGGIITGQFDTLTLPDLDSDLAWQINYRTDEAYLRVVAALQADWDGDNDVDGADFLAIQRSAPSLIPAWQAEYGSEVVASTPISMAVPEPASGALLLCTAMLLLGPLNARNQELF
ncbi:hypothetical protein [Adhaeretor mobilis]|uniref:Uncharacterized protein n=1 Tax=Adhaeretor mobilis TaxID=1930276 RepID=A0A517N1F7_9BACT|nr:hypothetical protein [Adhaeretor mobilis]QDT00970.1 hypothetical protein HG15A2_43120 [Adhaeretor mobilis]